MKYDKKDFTWGYEIEWGDIDRRISIPESLGKWEYAETDIVNIQEPHKYKACDPLGLDPCMGGEINTKPTLTWAEQVNNIMELHELFVQSGNTPSASCVNHGHLHVHIPNLIEDIEGLKKLIKYIGINQELTINALYNFYDAGLPMKKSKGAKMYLKYDGGRPMPPYMIKNILTRAHSFEDFIKLHAAGKDGVSIGRPFRYAINTYCLKHTKTIEFRCFRSSVKEKEIADQFKFVELFIEAALNDGPNVFEILQSYDFSFPPFVWNYAEYNGWINSKYDKSRGKKAREFIKV
tara:strand:+ start:8907 stop:9782 length:876 start_codon:yes stop_codon:yes gene_type:complete